MQTRTLDLNESVTGLARMLRRIFGGDIRLQLNLHPVPLWLRADAGMLDQILMNLAVNTRDAMPQGGNFNHPNDYNPGRAGPGRATRCSTRPLRLPPGARRRLWNPSRT